MQTSSIQVLGLSLTSPSRGENRLILKLENRDVVDRVCTVHVQTNALWFRGFGKDTPVEVPPQDTVECSIPYEWQASSGGVLTVTVFENGPGDVPDRSRPLFWMRCEQPVDPADLRGPSGCRFAHQAEGRIRAWAQEGGYASRHLDELVDERLRALANREAAWSEPAGD